MRSARSARTEPGAGWWATCGSGWTPSLFLVTEWTVELGFDTFAFWPAADPERQLALFTDEIVPAVRERVDAERSGR
ncbi:hypothetical protein ACFC0K_40545 [Streptomyces hydrogenans]|uniref:hypothetical protein n=1 Tax=Streptomyces hydrogenans TaxID=1873719 RepID=UPI0035E1D9BE